MSPAPRRRNAVAIAVAVGWIAFGLVVAIAAWQMDRLTHLRISPYSIPGLVPAILGILMVVFGSVLLARAKASGTRAANGADAGGQDGIDTGPATRDGLINALAAAALCIAFAAGLLGRGLPFTATAAGFIFAFMMWFNWRESAAGAFASGRLARSILQAAAVSLGAAFLVAWLFADVFLVRLP
ncbi:MAG: tripartite tricarboxylate transporter TctB family protein [Betaproteobacteria bacterium]|nr:tripartite tricarboxylate transporter TctB family protein [Betaproteobacteria bacterium]